MPRTFIALAAAFSVVFAVSVTATAQQDGEESGDELIAPAPDADDDSIERVEGLYEREPVMYQITFPQIKAIIVPSFMLDWFFDIHANTWSQGQQNWAFGAEFIIRRIEKFDLTFGISWADIRTQDDWWLESGKALVDADWGQNNLSLLNLIVTIDWLAEIKRYWQFYYGVGLGLAIRLGDFTKTDVDPACIEDAGYDPYSATDARVLNEYCFDDEGNPRLRPGATPQEEEKLPPILPAITLHVGTRWIIAEDWAIQLEVGWETIYFYGGLEFGYIWE